MSEYQKLYQFKQGDRVLLEGDDKVFVVGRADGACVNVYQETNRSGNWGPVYGWAPAKAAG